MARLSERFVDPSELPLTKCSASIPPWSQGGDELAALSALYMDNTNSAWPGIAEEPERQKPIYLDPVAPSPQRGRIVLAVTADSSVGLMRGLPAFLASRGWEVYVVSSPGPHSERLGRNGDMTVVAIPMERNPSPMRDFWALVRWIRVIHYIRPDAIWAGTPKAGFLGMVAGWSLRVPVRIYVLRGLRLETAHGWLRRVLYTLERLTFSLCSEALAVSPSLRDEVIRLGLVGRRKIVVLGHGSSNGVDIRRFRPRSSSDLGIAQLRNEVGLKAGVPVIGFVGRLTPDKGLALLRSASELLVRRGVAFQLLVIGGADGDGPDERRFPGNVNVFYTGPVADVSPYYQLMDVLCLPTQREGFPNVVLEAGASGVAVVTTDATGAVDSVIDQETGRVVSKHSAEALAEALADVLADPVSRASYGQRARAWVVENFGQDDVWKRIDAHLLEASRPNHGRRSQQRKKRKKA